MQARYIECSLIYCFQPEREYEGTILYVFSNSFGYIVLIECNVWETQIGCNIWNSILILPGGTMPSFNHT